LGKPNEWLTLEVIARGPHVITRVNGKPAAETYEAIGKPSGHILLQQHGAQTVVHFRKVEIKELPPEEPGWVQLFNGKDLAGWKAHPEKAGSWKVENGELVGTGDPWSLLTTERVDYQNFHFRVEVKINQPGDSGQYFRAQGEGSTGYEAQIAM